MFIDSNNHQAIPAGNESSESHMVLEISNNHPVRNEISESHTILEAICLNAREVGNRFNEREIIEAIKELGRLALIDHHISNIVREEKKFLLSRLHCLYTAQKLVAENLTKNSLPLIFNVSSTPHTHSEKTMLKKIINEHLSIPKFDSEDILKAIRFRFRNVRETVLEKVKLISQSEKNQLSEAEKNQLSEKLFSRAKRYLKSPLIPLIRKPNFVGVKTIFMKLKDHSNVPKRKNLITLAIKTYQNADLTQLHRGILISPHADRDVEESEKIINMFLDNNLPCNHEQLEKFLITRLNQYKVFDELNVKIIEKIGRPYEKIYESLLDLIAFKCNIAPPDHQLALLLIVLLDAGCRPSNELILKTFQLYGTKNFVENYLIDSKGLLYCLFVAYDRTASVEEKNYLVSKIKENYSKHELIDPILHFLQEYCLEKNEIDAFAQELVDFFKIPLKNLFRMFFALRHDLKIPIESILWNILSLMKMGYILDEEERKEFNDFKKVLSPNIPFSDYSYVSSLVACTVSSLRDLKPEDVKSFEVLLKDMEQLKHYRPDNNYFFRF